MPILAYFYSCFTLPAIVTRTNISNSGRNGSGDPSDPSFKSGATGNTFERAFQFGQPSLTNGHLNATFEESDPDVDTPFVFMWASGIIRDTRIELISFSADNDWLKLASTLPYTSRQDALIYFIVARISWNQCSVLT